MAKERRQIVRFLFLKLDPAWRRLAGDEQTSQKEEFGKAIKSFHAKLLLRTYSLVGARGDCDLLLWQAAEALRAVVFIHPAGNHDPRFRKWQLWNSIGQSFEEAMANIREAAELYLETLDDDAKRACLSHEIINVSMEVGVDA